MTTPLHPLPPADAPIAPGYTAEAFIKNICAELLPATAHQSPFYLEALDEYARQQTRPLPQRSGRRFALAAPRGTGKSILHTVILPLLDLVTARERHQVIITASHAQSKQAIAAIVHQLRTNTALHAAFFDGRPPRFRATTRSIELGPCRIEAFSAASELRGISHGEYRPTRIILDDVEQSRFASKPVNRRHLRTWYDEIVEYLGDNYTHITIVGTLLYTDGLLATLLHRPGFRSQLFHEPSTPTPPQNSCLTPCPPTPAPHPGPVNDPPNPRNRFRKIYRLLQRAACPHRLNRSSRPSQLTAAKRPAKTTQTCYCRASHLINIPHEATFCQVPKKRAFCRGITFKTEVLHKVIRD